MSFDEKQLRRVVAVAPSATSGAVELLPVTSTQESKYGAR